MKYKYAALTMFSCDLVPLYSLLLDKISRDHEQPHLHTATFLGQRGFTILSSPSHKLARWATHTQVSRWPWWRPLGGDHNFACARLLAPKVLLPPADG